MLHICRYTQNIYIMKIIITVVYLLYTQMLFGQNVSGFVKDKYQKPIIGASVRLDTPPKELSQIQRAILG